MPELALYMRNSLGQVRDEIRSVAREKLAPLESTSDPVRVNRPLIRELGNTGILQRVFSVDLGGSADTGESYALTLCTLRDALSQESTEASMALAVQAGAASPMVQSANRELRERWVPLIASGEAVPAFALTEPLVGSDAGALAMAASRIPGGWRLSGEKTWITNAPDADVYTVFARTGPGKGAKGVTAFVVPAGAEGLSGEPISSLKAHAIGRLKFDGVKVGDDHILGEVDGGFSAAKKTLDAARAAVGAAAVGAAHRAMEEAISYAKSRTAFGRRIGSFQAISHKIADMATAVESARLLVYESAAAFDAGARDTRRLTAMAKVLATENAQFVVDQAIQIHGASGLVRSHLLTRLYHEVRACRYEDGTSEITRGVIARDILSQ